MRVDVPTRDRRSGRHEYEFGALLGCKTFEHIHFFHANQYLSTEQEERRCPQTGQEDHTPHTVYSLTKRVSPEMLQTFDATEDIGYCDYLGTIHKV